MIYPTALVVKQLHNWSYSASTMAAPNTRLVNLKHCPSECHP
jgi:hypothetical protein